MLCFAVPFRLGHRALKILCLCLFRHNVFRPLPMVFCRFAFSFLFSNPFFTRVLGRTWPPPLIWPSLVCVSTRHRDNPPLPPSLSDSLVLRRCVGFDAWPISPPIHSSIIIVIIIIIITTTHTTHRAESPSWSTAVALPQVAIIVAPKREE